jgi:hypothetical protein
MDLRLWTLITFELWCRRFLDRQPKSNEVLCAASG